MKENGEKMQEMSRKRRNHKCWDNIWKEVHIPNIVNHSWSEESWRSIQESESFDWLQKQIDWLILFNNQLSKCQTHLSEESQQYDFE